MAEAHQLFSLSSDEKRLKHDNNSQSGSAWIHSDSGFFFFQFYSHHLQPRRWDLC